MKKLTISNLQYELPEEIRNMICKDGVLKESEIDMCEMFVYAIKSKNEFVGFCVGIVEPETSIVLLKDNEIVNQVFVILSLYLKQDFINEKEQVLNFVRKDMEGYMVVYDEYKNDDLINKYGFEHCYWNGTVQKIHRNGVMDSRVFAQKIMRNDNVLMSFLGKHCAKDNLEEVVADRFNKMFGFGRNYYQRLI